MTATLLLTTLAIAAHHAAPDKPRLAIVVPQALAASVEGFARAKGERYRVAVLTLEAAIKDAPGVDDPEKLKRRLYEEWKKDASPMSVLLVGDADVLPVRYMCLDRVTPEAFDYAFYPSDLYYADLTKDDGSFEDWNGAKDGFHAGYFGEVRGEKNKTDPMNYDGVSYTPEVALGRWPVSTPEQAAAVAAKALAYEAAVRAEKGRPAAAVVMVGGWVDARPTMDALAKALGSRADVERLFYQDGAEAWKSLKPPTAANVVAQNAAGARLILHSGHGSDGHWDQCISTHDIPTLRTPAVFMSAGCSTARFATLPPYEPYQDTAGVEHKGTTAGEVFPSPPPPPAVYARGPHNMTGLGEELVRAREGGAVAYIGCDTGSQPAALTLLAGFVDGLATLPADTDGFVSAGAAWRSAVAEYVKRERLMDLKPTEDWYPASIFFQGMKFMFFGDPTAPVLRP
jgi:hypothetical protein